VWLSTPLAAAVLRRTLLDWKSKCALPVQVCRLLLTPGADRYCAGVPLAAANKKAFFLKERLRSISPATLRITTLQRVYTILHLYK